MLLLGSRLQLDALVLTAVGASVDLNRANGVGKPGDETDLWPFDSVGGPVAEYIVEN